MNDANRRLNALAELEVAREALGEAETLFEKGLLRGSVSRSYYALFHAVKALLLSQGLEARTHHGVETLFSLHFIRAGELPAEWAALFARLQGYREQADYGPVLGASREIVRRELDEVACFHDLIRARLGA